jgi:hypothetical protein
MRIKKIANAISKMLNPVMSWLCYLFSIYIYILKEITNGLGTGFYFWFTFRSLSCSYVILFLAAP